MIAARDALFPRISYAPPQVHGLDPTVQDQVCEMFTQWAYRLPRNIERCIYLDAKNRLKDLAVAIPPHLLDKLGVVLGWPAKAVYELANRIVFERVTGPDGDTDPFGLGAILDDNRFSIELPQAVASSLAQSVAFVSTTPGDTSVGEPEVMIAFHSAMWSTGLWSRRLRRLTAGLIINDTDDLGAPTMFTVIVPGQVITCVKGGGGWYVEDVYTNNLGWRVPFEPLPFRPTLERPFGRSRIDRPVMSTVDRATRVAARLDVHSELFSAMKLILLGADADTFTDADGRQIPLWSFYMGRLNMLSKDEDGDLPKLEKITAESPEPHIATWRQLAAEFSGHTGVPLGSLGIATDNPESAGAKQEARQDIIGDAENQHIVYGAALRHSFENAVMLRDGRSEPPEEMRELGMRWRPPARPTLQAMADAGVKQLSSVPWLAETSVGLELLGLDSDQIVRAEAERRRAQGSGILDRILAGQSATTPTEAARGDIEPTGAVPASLRAAEGEARDLEEK